MPLTVYCLINEFDLKHPIYIVGDNTNEYLESVEFDDIGHTVVRYAHDKDIQNIILGGASRNFLDRFVDDIYAINALMYNTNNPIKVSIIEGE